MAIGSRIRDDNSMWELIGRKSTLDFRAILIYLIPAAMNPLFVDRILLGGTNTFWFSIIFQAHVLYALTLVTCRLVFFSQKTSSSRPFAVLFALILGQSLRGIFIGSATVNAGLTSDPKYLYRIVFGSVVLVPMALLIGLVIAIFDQHQQLIDSLSQKSVLLFDLKQNMQTRLDEITADLQSFVKKNITFQISELNATLTQIKFGGNVIEAIAGLRSFIDNSLRPMSKDLAQSPEVESESVVIERPKILRVQTPRRITVRAAIHPITSIGILIALEIAPATRFLSGIDLIAFLVFLAFAVPTVIYLAIALLGQRTLSTVTAGVFVCVFYASIGPVVIVSSRILNLNGLIDISGLNSVLFAEAIVGLLLGLGNFGYTVLTANRIETINQLQITTEDLEKTLSILRQHAWSRRRRLAYALHGNLQSALIVANIKLSQSNELTANDIDKMRNDIELAMRSLSEQPISGIRFAEVIEQLNDVWENTMTITWNVDFSATTLMDDSEHLVECVTEVIREGLSNAAKHGNAKNVAVVLTKVSQGIEVCVLDDGRGLTSRTGTGLGSDIMNELCLEWKLENRDTGGTKLVATVAVS